MMNHHLLLLLTTSLLVSCILTVVGTCPAGQSPCLTDRDMCVNSNQICDGTPDCQDQTDEIFCPCMVGEELKCDNSMAPSEDNCFALASACDGDFDCPPGVNTDEDPDTICGPSGVCPGNQILCPNETMSCARNTLFCDDNSDCPNMGDESPQFCGCPNNTESGEMQVAFQCATSLWACLNRTQICDGVSDCNTGYDEYPQNSICSPDITNSTMTSTNPYTACPTGQSPCLTDRDVCVNSDQICDGTPDCQDQTDEIFCPCMVGEELKCDNFMAPSEENCFALVSACDDERDCPDVDTDEDLDTLCGASGVCQESEILCPNETMSCVSTAMFCDDNSDCPNMGDESPQFCGCPNNTESGELQVAFQCATSLWVCLNRTLICDGVNDCDTGYDEVNSICSPDSTMATTNSSTGSTGLSTGAIVGIAVGAVVGVVLVAVVIVIIVLLVVCCGPKKKSKVQVISTEQTSPSKKAPMELAPVTK